MNVPPPLPAPGLSLETGGGRGPSPGTGTIKPLGPSHDQGGTSLSLYSVAESRQKHCCTTIDWPLPLPLPPPAAPGRLTENKAASVASKRSG